MSTDYIRDAIPIRATAKTLGCDGSLVMKLVNCGFLEGYKDGNATKIFFYSISAYQRRHTLAGAASANKPTGHVFQVTGLQHSVAYPQRRGFLWVSKHRHLLG